MGKLIETYTERIGVPKDSIRFIFDGMRLGAEDTPVSVGMVGVNALKGNPMSSEPYRLTGCNLFRTT
jgi:hypothetical protein